MPSSKFWLIRAITNLHAGSGDADFGIVDKHVQRDPVTGLPTINASSIKGAFREALKDEFETKEEEEKIFGTDNRKEKIETLMQGQYNFYSAKLLALPVRSSRDFFYVATCIELLEDFVRDAKTFDAMLSPELLANIDRLKKSKPEQGKPHKYGGSNQPTQMEDWNAEHKAGDSGLEALFGERVAILHSADFQVLSEELPIIARNHLENGISTNLWYEQVVPREARFYCAISGSDGRLEKVFKDKFKYQIQIGGNATVGYGLTRFTQL